MGAQGLGAARAQSVRAVQRDARLVNAVHTPTRLAAAKYLRVCVRVCVRACLRTRACVCVRDETDLDILQCEHGAVARADRQPIVGVIRTAQLGLQRGG